MALRALPFGRHAFWARVIQGRFDWRSFEFVKPARFGAEFAGNIEDLIPRYIYFFGCWEPHVEAVIASCLKPGDTFIDAGANVGYFSLLAAKLVGAEGRVYAFEACAATFRRLAENVKRNGAAGIIQARRVAVADRETILTLHRGPAENRGMASLVRDSGEGNEAVPAKPLQTLVPAEQLRAARLIKIDVEGAEELVMDGIDSILEELHSDILLEVNPALACWGRMERRLRAAGWEPYEIRPADSFENYFHLPVQPKLVPLTGNPDGRIDVFLARKERPLPC